MIKHVNQVFLLLAAVAAALVVPTTNFAADPSLATVKVYTVENDPSYWDPWRTNAPYSLTGSGCVISDHRILTNAHVISNAKFVQVRRNGDSKRYTARILAVSHEADLGLLTVDEPGFFDSVAPLSFGGLPLPQTEVEVYGFPEGGDALSVTKGVISRIEHLKYVHSSANLLAGQIDAAINPGNSGGPVIADGRVVGVVMQGIPNAQNIGYMVPVPIVEHFLRDLDDGAYDGPPYLGFVYQTMENADLRAKYQLPANRTGILVTFVPPGSPGSELIKAGDVILALDGHAIANDGTVEFRPRERTNCAYYVQRHQVGESVDVTLWRDGKEANDSCCLGEPLQREYLVPMERYDVEPTYYVYGGLVFVPFTKSFLLEWGKDWEKNASPELRALLSANWRTEENEEVVLLLKVLAADVNAGYDHGDFAFQRIAAVDGQPIRNLSELIKLTEKADGGPFVTFTCEHGAEIALDRAKVKENNGTVLATYRIPADRSLDLTQGCGPLRVTAVKVSDQGCKYDDAVTVAKKGGGH